MSTYGERLQQAMEARGVTPKALAAAIGVRVQSIYQVRSGKTTALTAENHTNAAKTLRVSPDWLATGRGTMDTAPAARAAVNLEANAEYPAVRRVRFKLSASASGYSVEYMDDDAAPIVFRADWLASRRLDPDRLFAVGVANGSMQPGLWAGDTVVVNTADVELRDGEVYAVNYEGELVIKRVVRDEGRWWLKSDNPDQARYPRKAIDETARVIGRIVHKQSEHL